MVQYTTKPLSSSHLLIIPKIQHVKLTKRTKKTSLHMLVLCGKNEKAKKRSNLGTTVHQIPEWVTVLPKMAG